MKGQRSSFGKLPENLSFDHGSTSSNNSTIDSHISWNNLQTPQNQLQDYRTSSNETINTQYSQHVHHQVEQLPYEPSNNILSLDNANLNTSNGIPQDLNLSSGFGDQEDNDCQIIGSSSDGRRISCKRKSLEFQEGQSSNSNSNGGSELANPRLVIGSGSDRTGRNFRLRVSGYQRRQVNPVVPQYPHVTDADFQDRSRLLVPPNPVENGRYRGQSQPVLLEASSAHQSRIGSSSAPAIYEEPSSRNIPVEHHHHPMFVPASEIGNSSAMNWNMGGGSSNNSISEGINGNVGSSSRVGPQYPRRLSEAVRRALLAGNRNVGQISNSSNNNGGVRLNSQEITLPDNNNNNGQRVLNSRSALLERHIDGAAFGMPHSLRALAAAGGQGRSSIMSEIRHVLDLMRRGEGLRFEDMMILENSFLFGIADMHDRHRDMRLDVDNMSYEELLALEERIGNVCTGLSEKTIMNRLKQRKYVDRRAQDQAETEPCSICREEYKDGEDLGTLECGHDFHFDCIRQWLMHKNLCPICKTTGLKT